MSGQLGDIQLNATEISDSFTSGDDSATMSSAWRSALVVTNAVVIPTVGVCGFVFNSLGIATLFHMGINSSSMVFMLILFVGDIWSGFVDSILTAGMSYWKRDLYAMSSFSCKFLKWINHSSSTATQFVLVLFTFDRVLAVTLPLKYRTLKGNLRYPIISCTIVTILVYMLSSGQLYVFDLVDGICQQAPYISELGGQVYFHLMISSFYCTIPSVMLFVFNIIILVQMKRNATLFNKGGRESAITRALLIVSFAFLFFTVITVTPVYLALFYIEPMMDEHGAWMGDLYVGLLQLAELPATANVSFNFVMYLLGSKIFRKEFKSMLRKAFGQERHDTGGTSVATENGPVRGQNGI